MATSKPITMQYFKIEAAEEDYFQKFLGYMLTCLDSGAGDGTFEAGEVNHIWNMLERVYIDENNTSAFLFSLTKEKTLWPAWMTENGEVAELSIPGGLGDTGYCLVCPAYEFVITCGPANGFKKLLGQFSPEGIVCLRPYYEDNIYDKVLNWDCYKKFAFSVSAANYEDVVEFGETMTGELAGLMGYLGGTKLDVSVAATGKGETLSGMMVKGLLPELAANDICKSLTVKGCDFEGAEMEQYDIKNAQIKYKESLVVEGNYITASDIKQVFKRALNERWKMLFGDVDHDAVGESVSFRKPVISKNASKEEIKAEIDRVEAELIDEYPWLAKYIREGYDKERRRLGVYEVQS